MSKPLKKRLKSVDVALDYTRDNILCLGREEQD